MNPVTRQYKFVGYDHDRLASSIPSAIVGPIVDSNGAPIELFCSVEFDADESNATDTDSAMHVDGWQALDPQP